jgi:hypothetical protein
MADEQSGPERGFECKNGTANAPMGDAQRPGCVFSGAFTVDRVRDFEFLKPERAQLGSLRFTPEVDVGLIGESDWIH